METKGELLRIEIKKFVAWVAANHPHSVFGQGEWEADYPGWEGLYQAALPLLRGESELDDEAIGLLLYAMARENEVRVLADEVPSGRLVKLARAALMSHESDAKWQLASRLATLPFNYEIEDLLLGFVSDANEYVRRRALLTLAECKSSHTERLAEQAWASEDEYQRMAALHALFIVNSLLLPRYLQMAQEDGREYLFKKALEIRQGKGEYGNQRAPVE